MQIKNFALKNNFEQNYKFSILIPTWNNLNYLKLCVESIRKNSTYSHQIIVHVNEGKDGTLQWMQQQTQIDYSHSENNIGICFALNNCRTMATCDYLVYLNDDMYVCPKWDEVLYQEIQEVGQDHFFISGTMIEPVASSNCVIEKNYGRSVETFDENALLFEFEKLTKNDWSGGTWPPNLVHKNLWDAVGGYSIEFSPGMYSDPDFSMKLWQAGVRYFKGVSKSRVYHFGSVSTKRVKKNKGYYKFISKWGITSRTFTSKFLQRGHAFNGYLAVPKLGVAIKIKSFYKRVLAFFNS